MKEISGVDPVPGLSTILNQLNVDQLKKLLKFINGAPKNLTKKREFVEFLEKYLLCDNVKHHLDDLKVLDRMALAETLHTYGGIFDSDAFSVKYGSKPDGVRGGFDSWGGSGAEPINLFLFPWKFIDFYEYRLMYVIPTDLAGILMQFVEPPASNKLPATFEFPGIDLVRQRTFWKYNREKRCSEVEEMGLYNVSGG